MRSPLRNNVLIGICALFIMTNAQAYEDPRSSKAFYQETIGVVEGNPLVDNAYTVFNRLLKIVNRVRAKAPELVIVDSDSWPWAVALPDNSIILSRGALEICYEDVSVELGDTRLAMILGHELSHLVEDDYWYRDTYVALNNDESIKNKTLFRFIAARSGMQGKDEQWLNSVRDREIRADDKGFLYAALAGYDVRKLVENNENFFEFWKTRTQMEGVRTHATSEERAAFITARLKELSGLAQAYQIGLPLIHFNYLDEAEAIYRRILQKLPAAEIYNNLGYIAFLRSGAQHPDNIKDMFWLPVMLDTSPETPILTRGQASMVMEIDKAQLDKAVELFRSSLSARPGYKEASINLATVYFYQEKYDSAVAILNEIQEQERDDVVESLIVLSRYYALKDTFDIADITVKKLIELHESVINKEYLAYNLAMLLTKTEQLEKAQEYWNRLAVIQSIPNQYKSVIAENATVEVVYSDNNDEYDVIDNWIASKVLQNESPQDIKTIISTTDGFSVDQLIYSEYIEYRYNNNLFFRKFSSVPDKIGKQASAENRLVGLNKIDPSQLFFFENHQRTYLFSKN